MSTFFMAAGLSPDGFRARGAASSSEPLSTVGRKRFLARRGCLPFAFAEAMRRLDGIVFEGRVSASCKKKYNKYIMKYIKKERL